MGLPTKPFCIFSLFLVIFTIFKLTPQAKSDSDYTKLIYKGCAKQDLSDPSGVYSQALSSLFGTLVSQSSKSKFYKTSTGSGQSTISGLFQCRGDLSNVDCYKCVSGLPILIDKLCGSKPVAARIQLYGCYMLYEVAGFPQISGMEMLFKTCSGKNAPGSGFEERRDTAFSTLENGMASSNGFYTTSYQSVYTMGQCEGDVGSADCADCVKNAVQKAQVECGSSVSGQIFLHKCFIGYSNSPNGVPRTSSSSSDWSPSSSSGSGQNVGKTVAIILGGVAGVAFILICVLFARNQMKKHDVHCICFIPSTRKGEKELRTRGWQGSLRWFIL
ncbi:cysteine-rich repeat secretory protein 3-like isoform X1 [Solanum tuberosum]|uniref:cysteine-rich repeat secretory protein 3-like isoform X1 n=1 Tax=Solanum tuberosum TaxID=4113 RepID=UPI00073A0B3A|nr:PREDICTED: cysteine-rich repeat secretory protein 3-like isoform X1 [Solanum tuberosum]